MASALTPKQEKFCTLYIELGNMSDAYRGAYDAKRMLPASVNRKAKELFDNVKIAARIDELREAHADRHQMTVDDIAKMLKEDRALARQLGAAAAAVSASMGLAKLYGHLREKVDHFSPDGSMTPKAPVYNITDK